ncbi:protocatechuate 3,4-dioxygenase subunit beta [Roseobacter litoralis]|uniref:Protocatechuate 3,4-dioxygenase beta chain n=1 Tax=Roseobacter litoralis (strain ATCC 49566 / DSM 6996 / JCM 21268 / NBRC 15278 / OCh 149) TaxID=391595 RepID=F7ZKN2_ROSLO|nr:protocatechuate 3,4-dioxygenase subunit beta [Roseobacter litoralis]AEI92698.1 protocatechuate 3,4-dioxygenase beta chain [Roseobacter litoralis Och 149]
MSKRALSPRNWQVHPPALAPAYKTSRLRAPAQPLIAMDPTISELTGPTFVPAQIAVSDSDLLQNHKTTGLPIGERIIVHGRVLDEQARPVPHTLVEIWQANASGRYRHANDSYFAPLDPNFGGCGRALTDQDGAFRFHTIKPGAYPWPNGPNSWRPAHIHFSVFGTAFAQRLITQMYFEGDPLLKLCPIYQAVPDQRAKELLVAPLDMERSEPFDSIAYRFDIVLRGARSTPFENRPEGN